MSELSAEKLAALREIASKATPGRWVFSPDDGSALDADVVFALDDAGEEVSTVTSWIDANDAEHIAAFDPPTVLQLLDRIVELETELAEFREREAASTVVYSLMRDGQHLGKYGTPLYWNYNPKNGDIEHLKAVPVQATLSPWVGVTGDDE